MADRYEAVSGAGAGRAREPVVGERSTVDLIKDIVADIQGLVRSEIRLASAEVREKAVSAGRAAITLVAGGVLMLYALGFLFTSIHQALSNAVAPWFSALIVFIGLAIIGSILLAIGWSRFKQVKPKPEMTVARVKEDVRWLKNQTR
jgi:membrane protein